MNINLELFHEHPAWPAVLYVYQKLIDNGFEALLAGGCVRDGVLGRKPKDFDIASNALPEDIQAIFPQTIDIGKAFGVILVYHLGHNIEVTRFRQDGKYADGRHPQQVYFSSAQEDAKRRDFTINGLFYDIKRQSVIDFVCGEEDLNNKVIRTIGDATTRFEEDALRMLRAIRFSSELNFEIEPKTWAAIVAWRKWLTKLSVERVTDEFRKTLTSENPFKGLMLLHMSGSLSVIWPELRLLDSPLYTKYLAQAFEIQPEQLGLSADLVFEERLASLLLLQARFNTEHVGGGLTFQINKLLSSLKQFRFSRSLIKTLHLALQKFEDSLKLNTESLLLISDPQGGLLLLRLLRLWFHILNKDKSDLDELVERYLKICNKTGDLPKAFLNGSHLEALHVPPGPIYRDILKEAYLLQLEGQFASLESALNWLKVKCVG